MSRITFLFTIAAFAALPVLGVGCVPQDKYDNLLTANRSLKEQLARVEEERDIARGGLNVAQVELRNMRTSYQDLDGRYQELNGAFDQLASENDGYMSQIAQLELGPLPPDLETALHDLAAAHPDLLGFDAKRGLLRFSSDFTFDLGSVELKTEAQQTIQALASILNEPIASGLEAHVVGHTDNVRIAKPETKRNHPTNVHLSVHRAIAVRDALTTAGVAPYRLQVAGYGEFRPIVANGSRGAAENRRVEILLAPMPQLAFHPTSPAPTGPPEGSVSVDPAIEEPMK